ncbi:cytochrome P450, putative [Ricinus communis]|uniref:Cytochrome P450, putative n=1 Tax=Ricinus communis TaxID=3988 RepID=B9SB72_RICCO|nr:cytochrome P450, putative [Ricinus communis]
MASLWLFSLLLLFPLFFFSLKKKRAKTHTKNHPPGPPSLPFIGNFHQLGVLPHQSLWQYSKKYGPVMLVKFGSVPTVIISSAEAAKELLKTHDLNSCSRPYLTSTGKLSYNHLDIAFAPYGDYWRDMRKLCVLELFSAKRVQSFEFIREEEVSLLIDSISKSSSSPVDMKEKIMTLTANITCRAAFGKNFHQGGLGHERFQEVIYEGIALMGSFFAADYFPGKIIDDHIQKGRRDETQQEQDIIDVLLQLETSHREQSGAFQFSKDNIKGILMNIFLAGVETGASVLEWTMAELIKNPRVMKKAQEEVRNCIGCERRVSENKIKKLEYLKMVLKEALRLHPPGPLLAPRETTSQFSINGYDIYPKTRIQVNVSAIGRDPRIWKDPENFYPERFIDSPINYKGMNYELLPFGSGRRGCPGITMGMAIVELALANLLFCFDWDLPCNMKVEDINMEEAAGMSIHKKEPLLLLPIAYEPVLRN